jgi:hypothetical protein
MDNSDRWQGGFMWPLILITAGVVFLLNNFGVLPWNSWDSIWRLWPLLLVVWGLQAIFGRSRTANSAIAILLIIVLIYIFVNLVAQENTAFRNWLSDNVSWWNSLPKPSF